jgi:hypothetical protein
MDQNFKFELQKLMNNPLKLAELLMPGYSKDIEKIIDQVINSAKTRFNYEWVVQSFKDSGLKSAEDFADYFVRVIVIEFGISLDFESGFDNCKERLNEVNFPFKIEDLKQIVDQLLPVLKKELGAIQKINYLTREATTVELIIEKIKKEIEIQVDDFGDIV